MSAWLASCNIMCIVLSRFDVRGRAVARAHASPTVNLAALHPPTHTHVFLCADRSQTASDGCVCPVPRLTCAGNKTISPARVMRASLFAALIASCGTLHLQRSYLHLSPLSSSTLAPARYGQCGCPHTLHRAPIISLAASNKDEAPSPPPRQLYDDDDVSAASDAANALMDCPRAEAGREAFEGTTWSVLMRMNEGGGTIFTVQLLPDDTCAFSDSDRPGSWECQDEWVVIEKPKGFFDSTLFFSARLQPPTKDKPKWRLVEGLVQRSNHTSSARKTPTESSDPVEEKPVEVVQIGTFGANEFEEALLVDMPRFQDEQRDEAMSEEETEQ